METHELGRSGERSGGSLGPLRRRSRWNHRSGPHQDSSRNQWANSPRVCSRCAPSGWASRSALIRRTATYCGIPCGLCRRSSLRSRKILCGVAVVENGYRQPCAIEVVPPSYDAFLEADMRLLKLAKAHLARIPFDELDLLIVDELGKTISGGGMDPNIIGLWRNSDAPHQPNYKRIVVLSLTYPSLGNGLGHWHGGFHDSPLRRFLRSGGQLHQSADRIGARRQYSRGAAPAGSRFRSGSCRGGPLFVACRRRSTRLPHQEYGARLMNCGLRRRYSRKWKPTQSSRFSSRRRHWHSMARKICFRGTVHANHRNQTVRSIHSNHHERLRLLTSMTGCRPARPPR